MRFSFFLFFLFISLFSFPCFSNAQVLPTSRSVDWTFVGNDVITNYANVVNIKDYGGVGDGIYPNDTAILNAINALSGGEGVIFFPSGIYLFNSNISLRSGLILRGTYSDSTTLKFDLGNGNDQDAISISGAVTTTVANLVNAGIRDSTFLYVDDASGFMPGDYLKLSFNDSSLLFSAWAYGLVGQIIKIQDVIGNKLVLERPLRIDYNIITNPKVTKLDMVTGVGMECLKIHRVDETLGQTSNVVFSYAANCWVSGVESYLCNFAHVEINASTNISILGSYFHDAHAFGGGGQGYGVLCQATSGDCLIENNIFRLLRHSMLLQSGANGNVFGYNYSIEAYWDEPILPANSAGDMVLHGNYPYANLFEGNIGQNIVIDDSHGKNGAFNTFFRNRAELFGIFMNNNPASDSQNFVGNEVTHSGNGLYFLSGNGHFEFGNNIKGTIHATGTTALPDTSYYYSVSPEFLNPIANWPSIGIPNVLKSGSIPAKERYLKADFTTCGSNPSTRINKVHTNSNQLMVFPNPTKGLVYVSSQDINIPLQVHVFNCLGQLKGEFVISKSNETIDLSGFARGVYILKAYTQWQSFLPIKLLLQ